MSVDHRHLNVADALLQQRVAAAIAFDQKDPVAPLMLCSGFQPGPEPQHQIAKSLVVDQRSGSLVRRREGGVRFGVALVLTRFGHFDAPG